MEPFQFWRQRRRSSCLCGTDKKRVIQAGAGIQQLLQVSSVQLHGSEGPFWGAEKRPIYGAIPSSKGVILSCGKHHSQNYVLDPAQLPCLKAAQQGSGDSAETLRWGRLQLFSVVVSRFGLRKKYRKSRHHWDTFMTALIQDLYDCFASGNWKDWKSLTDSVNCPEIRI